MNNEKNLETYEQLITESHKRTPWGIPVADRAAAVAAIDSGESFRSVTKRFKVGTSQLQTYCKLCGVSTMRPRLAPEAVEGIMKELAEGLTISAIASRYSVSERQVYRYAAKGKNHEGK